MWSSEHHDFPIIPKMTEARASRPYLLPGDSHRRAPDMAAGTSSAGPADGRPPFTTTQCREGAVPSPEGKGMPGKLRDAHPAHSFL